MGKPSEPELPYSHADATTLLTATPLPDEIGRLDGYQVVRLLGRGGMGAVYEAIEVDLNRKVALKVMLSSAATDPQAKARFSREAEAQAKVEHDHIIAIHRVGEVNGIPFITMPLLRGQTLAAALLIKPRLPLSEVVRIGREMAEGLKAAHAAGLIHRDIKPANVWLEGETRRVKILDFGLARIELSPEAEASDVLRTAPDAIMGTPAYMSPEQALSRKAEASSDLFSLGVVLYEMTTGIKPFQGNGPFEVMQKVVECSPPTSRDLNPRVPPLLSDLIAQLMAKDPADRPASADVVVRELDKLAEPPIEQPALPIPLPEESSNPWSDIETRSGDVEAENDDATEMMGAPRPIGGGGRPIPPRPVWLKPVIAGTLMLLLIAVGGVVAAQALKSKPYSQKTDGGTPEGQNDLPPKVAPESKRVPDVPPKKLAQPELPPFPDLEAARHVLQRGGSVQIGRVDVDLTREAQLPSTPFDLTNIIIKDKILTDADIVAILKCRHLISLALTTTNVTDAMLEKIGACEHLSDINLFQAARISDSAMLTIAGFKLLRSVNLEETAITDAGLIKLKDNKHLVYLNVTGTIVTESCVRDIAAALPKCEILYTGGHINPPKKDKPTSDDAERSAARAVIESGGSVTVLLEGQEKLCEDINSLPEGRYSLVGVHLKGNKTTAKDVIKKVGKCKSLKSLYFFGCGIDDADLEKAFAGNPQPGLTELNFIGCTVGIKGLTALGSRKLIDVSIGHRASNEVMQYLGGCPELSSLRVEEVQDEKQRNISAAGAAYLLKCSKLKHLDVRKTNLQKKDLENLADKFKECTILYNGGSLGPPLPETKDPKRPSPKK